MPIKGTSPNKGTPYSLEEPNAIINGQNRHSVFNNCPIFNPKPPLENWERKLSPSLEHPAPLLGRLCIKLCTQTLLPFVITFWVIPRWLVIIGLRAVQTAQWAGSWEARGRALSTVRLGAVTGRPCTTGVIVWVHRWRVAVWPARWLSCTDAWKVVVLYAGHVDGLFRWVHDGRLLRLDEGSRFTHDCWWSVWPWKSISYLNM